MAGPSVEAQTADQRGIPSCCMHLIPDMVLNPSSLCARSIQSPMSILLRSFDSNGALFFIEAGWMDRREFSLSARTRRNTRQGFDVYLLEKPDGACRACSESLESRRATPSLTHICIAFTAV